MHAKSILALDGFLFWWMNQNRFYNVDYFVVALIVSRFWLIIIIIIIISFFLSFSFCVHIIYAFYIYINKQNKTKSMKMYSALSH